MSSLVASRPPKFKRGMVNVFYNAEARRRIIESREKLRAKYPSHELGESPLGRLNIYDDPHWNGKTWVYPYDYGCFGDHEGYAEEEDLEVLCDRTSSIVPSIRESSIRESSIRESSIRESSVK